MTEAVVDTFEVVQVDEDHADGLLVAAVQFDGVPEPVQEHGAVGQSGQLVVERLPAHPAQQPVVVRQHQVLAGQH